MVTSSWSHSSAPCPSSSDEKRASTSVLGSVGSSMVEEDESTVGGREREEAGGSGWNDVAEEGSSAVRVVGAGRV